MVKENRSRLKRLLVDIAGILLMIISPFLGWLPGPGGIPLFLAGLGLVATNHEWAERRLKQLEKHAENIGELIFPNKPIIMNVYDASIVVLLALGVFILTLLSGGLFIQFFGAACITASLLIFLGNRQRYKKIQRYFKR